MKKRLVIYHDRCIDGWTAAWAAWRRFGDDHTEYLPASYGDPPPDVLERDVYIVDFSYPRAVLEEMYRQASNLIVLDHHKTAQADLAGLQCAVFDMERSGAGITWDWLSGLPVRPWLIDYVEDRDLWRFKLPNSKQVNAWISAQKRTDFAEWNSLLMAGPDVAEQRGAAVLHYIDRYIEEMAVQARTVAAHGYDNVPIVNAPYINISELCSHLATDAPFAIGWFQRKDGKYQYSLRSSDKSDVDVSEIAKQYPGGGGHKHAAGFASSVKVW